jgi:hypothetical protein
MGYEVPRRVVAALGRMAFTIVVVKKIRLDRQPHAHSRRRVVWDQLFLHIRAYVASRMESRFGQLEHRPN